MSKPTYSSLSSHPFFIPTHRYSFSLSVKDFRLLWAINGGSESLLPYVPIYKADLLSNQLDAYVSVCLESQLFVNSEHSVTLPQICQWYIKDFEYSMDGNVVMNSSSSGATRSILKTLVSFCKGEKGDALISLLDSNAKKSPRIVYTPFIFRCRMLECFSDIYDDEDCLHGNNTKRDSHSFSP